MPPEIVLERVEFSSVEVTRFTRWCHAEVFDATSLLAEAMQGKQGMRRHA